MATNLELRKGKKKNLKLTSEKLDDLREGLLKLDVNNINETMPLFISHFENELKGSKIIYITTTGSILHGTSSPKSDSDYKGIYIPSMDKIILDEVTPVINLKSNEFSKNSNIDIDIELYSIFEFFKLTSEMEANNLEILFSMFTEFTIFETEESFLIKDNYEAFISANVRKLIGFSLSIAYKYSVKGERLQETEDFFNLLKHNSKKLTKQEYKTLPINVLDVKKVVEENNFKFIKIDMALGANNKEIEYLFVLSKKYPLTFKVHYVLKKIEAQSMSFGKRAVLAKENNNLDYKAFAHALRSIWQGVELLTTGKLQYPIPRVEENREIKFSKTKTVEELSDFMELELEKLIALEESKTTVLPMTFDTQKLKQLKLDIFKIFMN